jgi:hypothetical protein
MKYYAIVYLEVDVWDERQARYWERGKWFKWVGTGAGGGWYANSIGNITHPNNPPKYEVEYAVTDWEADWQAATQNWVQKILDKIRRLK